MKRQTSFEFSSPPEIAMILASRLRRLRIHEGLTQKRLADRIGITVRTLHNFETNGRATFETFLRIVKNLGQAGTLEKLFEMEFDSIQSLEAVLKTKQRQRAKRSGAN